MKIDKIDEVVGGQKVPARGSIATKFEIINGTLEEKKVNYNETIKISSIKEHNLLGKSMVEVNDIPFWKYTDDPYADQ